MMITDDDGASCPVSLRVREIGAMLNAELADHPDYDGFELQWFDDDVHGTGMLAFLSRRGDRTVDYYVDPALRVDRGGYGIGGGIRSWNETPFDAASLVVDERGVAAHARFTDVDGRVVVIAVDDRAAGPRIHAGLLAPFGDAIEHPASLMLVWMPEFDLVRATGRAPVIEIGGAPAAIGSLPGARLHRRHLIKYASHLCVVEVNRVDDAPATAGGPGRAVAADDGGGVAAVRAAVGDHRVTLALDPAWPAGAALSDGEVRRGRWTIDADDARLTGGTWAVRRAGEVIRAAMDVRDRWRPHRLPLLMRIVTTVIPVFRRWPTTYAWRATVPLTSPAGPAGEWRRLGARGDSYRRATESTGRR